MSVVRSARAIDEDPALRIYAVVLSVLHALTGVAWLDYKNIATLVSGEDYVCWPLFADCYRLRALLSPEGVRAAVFVYMAMGLGAAALFASRRPRAALVTFVGATVLGCALYALDYRLRLNQTYMFGWVVLVFLFAPKKVFALQALVALFYVWAGTLKLDAEWLSGASLYARPYLVPEALVPPACVYVVVLEMILVWALFSPRPAWRWAVYAQLVLFHALSWGVVGYFYPLLMLSLTAIYPLAWRRSADATLTWPRLRRDRALAAAVAGVALAFSSFQLVPYLFPGDTALTGEGRLFALHMFDARPKCEGGAILTASSGKQTRALLINENLDARTRCDPITLHAAAERLCRLLEGRAERVRVDVAIDARRASDPAMVPLIHADDVCGAQLRYSPWRHNSWISIR